MRRLILFGVAAALLAPVPAARAQLIAYESFSYPPGNLNGQTGGTGFATPWVTGFGTATVLSGSLTPSGSAAGLPTAGNHVSVVPDISTLGSTTRTLTQPVAGTAGSTAWLSVVMLGDGTNSGAFTVSDGGFRGFSFTTGTASGPPTIRWTLSDLSLGGEVASSTPSTVQSLLVARVTFLTDATHDRVDLFINPPPGVNPPPAPDVFLSVLHAATLGTFELATASPSGTPTTQFDEIRIGATFADVVAAPVPEPSTLVLVGAAGLGGAIVRRRRRRAGGY